MPSNLQFADSAFPNLTAEQSQEEKTRVILNYLYMLLEQLRYSFGNLSAKNFNDAALEELVTLIREPVYVQLSDLEGNLSSLSLEAGLLASRISDAEGNISALTQTAGGLTSRVSNAEGSISTLSQTATALSSRITNAEGNVSAIAQTVDSISLSVVNGENSSWISLTKNGVAVSSQTIQMTGFVTFSALGAPGMTTINGDNIVTGTITGTTFLSVANVAGQYGYKTVRISDGEIVFGATTGPVTWIGETIFGKIYTDTNSNSDGQARFYIETPARSLLKLYSGGDMSIDAANYYNVYIGTQDGTRQTVHIGKGDSIVNLNGTVKLDGTVNLNGTVYVNGKQIS